MIELEGVSKTFKGNLGAGRVVALDNLTMSVREGEIFGCLGPNGAGKSTAIKILLNFIYPDSGKASIRGMDVGNPEVRKEVGFLPENPYFYDHLTSRELLWFGGKVAGMKREEIAERTACLLEKVNLEHAAARPLRTYSKGMVQRAGIALALVHDPKVVILDEPMSGLDPIGRKMIVDIILELKSQGKTVFFSSHILSDIERLCDSVGIIVNGRLRVMDSLNKLLPEGESLEEVFLRVVAEADIEEVR